MGSRPPHRHRTSPGACWRLSDGQCLMRKLEEDHDLCRIVQIVRPDCAAAPITTGNKDQNNATSDALRYQAKTPLNDAHNGYHLPLLCLCHLHERAFCCSLESLAVCL